MHRRISKLSAISEGMHFSEITSCRLCCCFFSAAPAVVAPDDVAPDVVAPDVVAPDVAAALLMLLLLLLLLLLLPLLLLLLLRPLLPHFRRCSFCGHSLLLLHLQHLLLFQLLFRLYISFSCSTLVDNSAKLSTELTAASVLSSLSNGGCHATLSFRGINQMEGILKTTE